MPDRPKRKIRFQFLDWLLEFSGLIVVVSTILLHIFQYPDLPDIIPTHFDGSGVPNSFDHKSELFPVLIINVIAFVVLSSLGFYPEIMNYPITITEANAESQYRLMTRFLRFFKLMVCVLFGAMQYLTILIAKKEMNVIPVWLMPAFLGLIAVSIGIYWLMAKKLDQTQSVLHS